MIEEEKVWFYFVCSNLLPSKHLNTMRKNEAILLYAIFKGYKLSVGKIIDNSILSYFRSNYRGLLPHVALITKLCILGGVEGDWEEEETCRTPPRPDQTRRLDRTQGRGPLNPFICKTHFIYLFYGIFKIHLNHLYVCMKI